MKDVWIIEYRRTYIKGDKYYTDYVIPRFRAESVKQYDARAKTHIEGRNRRPGSFTYRARKFSPIGHQ